MKNTQKTSYINIFTNKLFDLIKNEFDRISINNYFIFNGLNKPNIIIYKNSVNFNLNNDIIEDYLALINKAIDESIQNTNYFIKNYKSFLNK